MNDGFSVEQIDHVEVLVPDVNEAAAWYERVLGLTPVANLPWTEPLMISSDGGSTKLALFEGKPQEGNVGWRRVAFKVTGAAFLRFLNRLEDAPVRSASGSMVTAEDVVDHDVSFSIYFADPYGNQLEVTTYDHDEVQNAIAR
jgi:catechol 2,3-dioxygenase-like lactoylglutathione lyase family enzyme